MDWVEGLQWIGVLLAVITFSRFMNNPNNPLDWWHFISTKGKDGKYYADLDKLGKSIGILVASVTVMKISFLATIDFTGFAMVLGTYLAFVGGIAGYSAYLRYRNTKTEIENGQSESSVSKDSSVGKSESS